MSARSRKPTPEEGSSGSPAPEAADRVDSLESGPETEVVIQGSRFLGQSFAVENESEAAAALDGVRRRHHDATHHCWAFRLDPELSGTGQPGDPGAPVERWNDDGEPSGTAGVPILGALRREGLFQALVVVTRYFGGTKLGTGGLTRAYGESAREAVEASARRALWRTRSLEIACAFDDLGPVENLLGRSAPILRDVDRAFEPSPRFRIVLLRSRLGEFERALVEATAGRAEIRRVSGS